jgi:Na+-driven multidrug efflux pump
VACANATLTIATIVIVTALVGRYGTAALAGYGLGSRLELMLIPLAYGVGGALTAIVGANFGARNFARARQAAWLGGLAVFAAIAVLGVTVSLAPDLWIDLFTTDEAARDIARRYLRIAGLGYAFFAFGMTLYFASQGTGSMLWPFAAGSLRLVVAAGAGAALALWLEAPLDWLFACVAVGLVLFGAIVGLSLLSRAWNPVQTP